MELWLIILIVICGLIYFITIPAICYHIWESWKSGKKLHLVSNTFIAVFAPLHLVFVALYLTGDRIIDTLKNIKKQGGIKGYLTWRKWEKLRSRAHDWIREKDREEEAIVSDAYKKGKIRRDEIPKSANAISDFELHGNLFGCVSTDLVYVENEYNETINDFFKRNPEIKLNYKGLRIVYLPQRIKDISCDEVLRYWNPGLKEHDVSHFKFATTDLLADLCYPDDAQKLRHGLMYSYGYSFNYDIEYLHGQYFPLEESDDEGLLSQIDKIAKEIYIRNTSGLFCTVERPSKDKKPTKDFADEHFYWEVNTLVDEIRERVERLEQHGISKIMLMKMLSEERELSRVVITKDMRIILPDYHDMEIKMEPLNKAVYLLFLRHPEGIVFKTLPDYRKELWEIYQKIKSNDLTERAKKSIEDVTNPCLNSINEKCARIRGAFISQFDDSLAKNYYIDGHRGEAKKIALPRDLVVWE